jgi:hypothetical protein
MNRFRWPLSILLVCLPLALIVFGVRVPGLSPTEYAATRPVPEGDRELAWFNTTTAGATWERFVAGARRAAADLPGLTVDDSGAFLDQTTAVPEVVLGWQGRAGKLRIRWYKLGGDFPPRRWAELLANRDSAPLAVIGGGSSDRARDMARALARQSTWRGARPLFFLTNATAEKVHTGPDEADRADTALGETAELLRIYEGRSFRFCFNNRQMADAILDFVWQSPHYRPRLLADDARLAVAGGALAVAPPQKPTVFYVDWDDDPYSSDLIGQFRDLLYADDGPKPPPIYSGWKVPYSVGGFYRANRPEEDVADAILKELDRLPAQRTLLILPTAAAPARRMIRLLASAEPELGRRLVAINGDGMGANTVLRDGEFAWPVRVLAIPVILFTHNNPVGWDDGDAAPGGFPLAPPNSTEDVLHVADMVKAFARAAYGEPTDTLAADSDELARRLQALRPAFFDETGNRVGGRGEFICVVRPRADSGEVGLPEARFEAWRRAPDRSWQLVRSRVLATGREP